MTSPIDLFYFTRRQYTKQLRLMGALWSEGRSDIRLRETLLGWRCPMGDSPVARVFDTLTREESHD